MRAFAIVFLLSMENALACGYCVEDKIASTYDRVALDTFTLSLAFDPRRTSLAALQGALDARLASRKLSAFPLRVIERSGELKEAAARQQ